MNNTLEENKRIVREWHELAIRKTEEAVAKYLGTEYRQHNGPESFITTVKWFAQNLPECRMETKRIIAEGDLVNAIEISIVIKQPIEDVFAFLANLENDVKWHRAFVEVRKTSGESLGVGSRFLVFEGVLGRRTPATEYEVIEYEPSRIAAWKTVSGPLQLKFWRTFERVESGTRFAVRYEGEPRGFFKLAWPLITRMVKRQQGSDLRRLKELMEVRLVSHDVTRYELPS